MQDAAEYVEFPEFVLRLIGKTEQKISALVWDNEGVDRALARECDEKLCRCYSHCLNLALQEFSETYSQVKNKVKMLLKNFFVLFLLRCFANRHLLQTVFAMKRVQTLYAL